MAPNELDELESAQNDEEEKEKFVEEEEASNTNRALLNMIN